MALALALAWALPYFKAIESSTFGCAQTRQQQLSARVSILLVVRRSLLALFSLSLGISLLSLAYRLPLLGVSTAVIDLAIGPQPARAESRKALSAWRMTEEEEALPMGSDHASGIGLSAHLDRFRLQESQYLLFASAKTSPHCLPLAAWKQ
eukprot:CAMPEP_0117677978 /NCGR_PEP_ID=MMETSP0804-20121206/17033_1 /TAXON_ID=1074897 /ORGANISM="Tetraselmis astigmatica, Strain CCMP880" /LENGTH=150 /DNA_ID=CAMNT_0005487297 /DNA_START=64 /DNA_END=518 /DNA_ORIENTATION=+